MMGDYRASGKVLTLPVSGNGKCQLHFGQIDTGLTITLKEVNKGKKKYFDVTSFKVHMDPKEATFNFENLFNNDKVLSENMNKFLNQNSEVLVTELKPAFSKALSKAFTQVTKQIFSKIPANEINIG